MNSVTGCSDPFDPLFLLSAAEAIEESHRYLSSLFAKKLDAAEQDAPVNTEISGDISVTGCAETTRRLQPSLAKELETESGSPFVILSAHRTPLFHFQVRLVSDAVAKVRDFRKSLLVHSFRGLDSILLVAGDFSYAAPDGTWYPSAVHRGLSRGDCQDLPLGKDRHGLPWDGNWRRA